jgi:hypothetical protein
MAKLFVVPKQELQKFPESEEEELFQTSGDVAEDLEGAVQAMAFLLDFIIEVGGSQGLRRLANLIGAFRRQA